MKTPQEWAEYLPEPIRTEFLENIDEGYEDYKEHPDSLPDAIDCSFNGMGTKQGYNYWCDIYFKAKNGEFDTPPTQKTTQEPKHDPKAIQLLRDVETEVNISGIISNHTYSEIVKLLKELDNNNK